MVTGGGDQRPTGRPDVEAGSELVELGETPIASHLEVDPVSVSSRADRIRRLDPRLAVVGAVAIVTLAVLGTGPLVPGPSSSATPGPTRSSEVGLASASPTATADPCPIVPLPAPAVTLNPRHQYGIQSGPAVVSDTATDVGFVPPVDRSLEIGAGYRMEAVLSDDRCVDALGIDLHGTSQPGHAALTIVPLGPLAGGRTVGFDAPPAGDWVLRVTVRLRGPTFSTAPWAVYFFRLNVGYVAYESPVPEGFAGPSEEPLVTPAVPCGSPDLAAAVPPAVELEDDNGLHVAGILGEYRWNGHASIETGLPDLSAVTPIDLTTGEPIALRVADQVCAVRWRIEAGTTPEAGQPLESTWSWNELSENPSGNPIVAAQNVFPVTAIAFGNVVISATFDFSTGDHEVVYWRAKMASLPIPEAQVAVEPSGIPVAPVVGCGISVQFANGTGGGESCGPSWPELPGGPILTTSAGTTLRVDLPGWKIVSWLAQYAAQSAVRPSGNSPDVVGELESGSSSVGFASVEVPSPPSGEWSVLLSLGLRQDADVFYVPYYVRINVTG
jgi:hypothetical protein